ncbi:MAG: hypothetical protein IJK46_10225 [Prevotella sp.]|nr:hypothetical protein [Prevotella sp.]
MAQNYKNSAKQRGKDPKTLNFVQFLGKVKADWGFLTIVASDWKQRVAALMLVSHLIETLISPLQVSLQELTTFAENE